MALVLVVVLGVGAILVVGANRTGSPGLDLGIPATHPLTTLTRGEVACEGPLPFDQDFDVVEFTPAPGGKRGPSMRVAVLDFDSRRVLAERIIPAGVLSGQPTPVRFDRPVGAGQSVDICITSLGKETVQIYGDPESDKVGETRLEGVEAVHPTLTIANGRVNGKPIGADFFVRFPGAQQSFLAESPVMLKRASHFRFPGFGPWIYWLLLAGLLIGGPVALSAALRAADRE